MHLRHLREYPSLSHRCDMNGRHRLPNPAPIHPKTILFPKISFKNFSWTENCFQHLSILILHSHPSNHILIHPAFQVFCLILTSNFLEPQFFNS